MRLVTWVSWGFLCSVAAMSCSDPIKPPGNDTSSGGDAGGSGGNTGGGVSKGGCESSLSGSSGTGQSGGVAGVCAASGGTAGTPQAGSAGSSTEGGTGGAGDGGASGDGSGGEGGDGGARSFFDDLWAAYCTYLFTCKIPNDDHIGQRLFMGTEARCVDILRELLGEGPPTQDLLVKIADGSVRFVPERVAECLVDTRDCGWPGRIGTGPACRSVFEGEVPVGGACERWEDCAGNAYCNHTDGCPGRCVTLGAPGATCEEDQECDSGSGFAFCDRSGTEPVCKRLAFGTVALENEDCTVSLASATELVPCETGFWCDPGDGSLPTGTCRLPIPDGQPCDSGDDVCVDGDVCLDDTSCERPQIVRDAGSPCDEAASIYCDPFAGLDCTATGCQAPGDGTRGSACISSDILAQVNCDPGLYCASTNVPDGTCEPLIEANGDCMSDSQCASGTCTGTCTARYCD
jgi:hypothetical protein